MSTRKKRNKRYFETERAQRLERKRLEELKARPPSLDTPEAAKLADIETGGLKNFFDHNTPDK